MKNIGINYQKKFVCNLPQNVSKFLLSAQPRQNVRCHENARFFIMSTQPFIVNRIETNHGYIFTFYGLYVIS